MDYSRMVRALQLNLAGRKEGQIARGIALLSSRQRSIACYDQNEKWIRV
jgi:hypothetical protein